MELLYAPVQFVFRWMDEHPGVRMAFAIALFATAILAPIPGEVLDVWLVVALGNVAAMALLLVVVGSELDPREALAGLPAFLRRFAFHRLALSIALTKAILLGHPVGHLMEWLADQGLGNSVGVGVAAIAAIYAGRLASAHFPQFERLSQAASRLPVEYARMEQAIAAGRLSPSAAKRARQSLSDEMQVLGDARQIFRLLRLDALGSLIVALVLVGAGLGTGLIFKEWPLALTLSTITLFSLSEAILTSLPGLIFAVTLGQWMGGALDALPPGTGTRVEAHDPLGTPLLSVEIGVELAGAMRKGFPARVALVRTRIAHELGYSLPRVDLVTLAGLPPRGYRISVRGVTWGTGTLAPGEAAQAIAQEVEQAARSQAASLLTLDASQQMLDELAVDHPVAVAQAFDKLGLATLHGVFLGLLREQVGLRDLAGLVDILVGLASTSTSVPLLIEHARRACASKICQRLADDNGAIVALELDTGWDEDLAQLPGGLYATTGERAVGQDLASAVRESIERMIPHGTLPVLIVPRRYRPLIAEALSPAIARLAVLAPDELAPRFDVRLVGRVARPEPMRVEAPLS